ncbi:MAG: hypothetical protein AVDCRST_MAG41-23, partial [uncultured Corynebacteriales bacterium]
VRTPDLPRSDPGRAAAGRGLPAGRRPAGPDEPGPGAGPDPDEVLPQPGAGAGRRRPRPGDHGRGDDRARRERDLRPDADPGDAADGRRGPHRPGPGPPAGGRVL